MKTYLFQNAGKIFFVSALVYFLSVCFYVACAQTPDKEGETQTLFGNGKLNISGFGAPIVEFSNVKGQFSVSNGGGGAALFNQTFFVGGYGVGLSNRIALDVNNTSQRLEFGHGGFWLGYINSPKKLLHFISSIKLGWGSVNMRNNNYGNNLTTYSNTTFVTTPEVGFEVNIARFFRISATAGYRFVTGISKMEFTNGGVITENLTNADFSSPMGSISFKFGWFGK